MDIVIRPLVTEKTMQLAEKGWYVFAVPKEAKKRQVGKAIATQYGVTVVGIRSIAMKGKMRRVGRKGITKEGSDWKKILVSLSKGQTIDVMGTGEHTAVK